MGVETVTNMASFHFNESSLYAFELHVVKGVIQF